MSVLLDSVILIDHLNGNAAATRYLRSAEDASISVITRAEVLAGVPNAVNPVMRLLDRYPTLNIDRDIADFAAELRRLYRWRLRTHFRLRWPSGTTSSSRPGTQKIFRRRDSLLLSSRTSRSP